MEEITMTVFKMQLSGGFGVESMAKGKEPER